MAQPTPYLRVEWRGPQRPSDDLVAALAGAGVELLGEGDGAPVVDVDVVVVTSLDRPSRRRDDPRILALVGDVSPEAVEVVLRAGVRGVLDVASTPDAVVRAVLAVARGYVVLPAHGARLAPALVAASRLTEEEGRWMDQLADGRRVPEVASELGLNEKLLYHRLADVYRRLGASSRRGAIAAHLAQRRRLEGVGR